MVFTVLDRFVVLDNEHLFIWTLVIFGSHIMSAICIALFILANYDVMIPVDNLIIILYGCMYLIKIFIVIL